MIKVIESDKIMKTSKLWKQVKDGAQGLLRII